MLSVSQSLVSGPRFRYLERVHDEGPAAVIAGLRELGWLLSAREEDHFRARAYQKAADALASYEGDLDALIDAARITELRGVGAGTARVVGELYQTGRARVLSDLRQQFPRDARRLVRVPGLGLSRLQKMHAALGIQTVADLRTACADGSLAKVKGFGAKTVEKIAAGIESLDDQPAAWLLPRAEAWARQLLESLPEAVVTGSLRRRCPSVDVIELLLATHDPQPPVLPELRWRPCSDGSSFEANNREGMPVVLHLASRETFGTRLLQTTGPEPFVAAVLEVCPGPFASEQDHLERAGIPPWPPEVRHAFSPGRPAPTLIERSDVRGAVHCHTTRSDGRNTLLEMATEAKRLGFEYLTVTDHSPTARYAQGLDLKGLKAQATEAAEVEAAVGIRVLRGTESDIQRDGGLDHPIEVLEQLDVVIASIHGRFRLDPEAMTERLLRTFDLPIRMIWGHPLGRLLLSRAPIQLELEAVLDRIAERGHIIEINGDPHRMDFPPELVPLARERGISFVLSCDAHSVRGLSMVDSAVDCARSGGLDSEAVLNTEDAESFLSKVRPSPIR